MQRLASREILDGDSLSPEDVHAVFDDLWRINRWFGGVSGSLRLLRRVLARIGPRPARILDVGAGDGRMARFLSRQLKAIHIEAAFFALDRQFSHIRGMSPEQGLPSVVADALRLPFPPASFDLVMSNLFLHHFSPDAAKLLSRSMLAIASEAVLINDLDRRWLPYFLIRRAPLLTRNIISRLDGAASVRQAYTRREMASIAAESGARSIEIIRLRFFRHGLVLWK